MNAARCRRVDQVRLVDLSESLSELVQPSALDDHYHRVYARSTCGPSPKILDS